MLVCTKTRQSLFTTMNLLFVREGVRESSWRDRQIWKRKDVQEIRKKIPRAKNLLVIAKCFRELWKTKRALCCLTKKGTHLSVGFLVTKERERGRCASRIARNKFSGILNCPSRIDDDGCVRSYVNLSNARKIGRGSYWQPGRYKK